MNRISAEARKWFQGIFIARDLEGSLTGMKETKEDQKGEPILIDPLYLIYPC
jgi:hypothetical protein